MDTKTRKCVQFSILNREAHSPKPASKSPLRGVNIAANLLPKRVQGRKLPLIPEFFYKRQFDFLIVKFSIKIKQVNLHSPLRITIVHRRANANVQNASVGGRRFRGFKNFRVNGINAIRRQSPASGIQVGGWKTDLMSQPIPAHNRARQ